VFSVTDTGQLRGTVQAKLFDGGAPHLIAQLMAG
jgi:hypothetical protein